jgi:hypothetical protein
MAVRHPLATFVLVGLLLLVIVGGAAFAVWQNPAIIPADAMHGH